MRTIIYACLTASATWVGGCASQPSQPEPLALPGVQAGHALRVCVDTLGKMHFTIDKVDRTTGAIRTRPLPAGQFFELWRSDNVGLADMIEANLQTITRTAWVTVAPAQSGVRIDCLVKVQRLDIDLPQMTSYTEAYRLATTPSSLAASDPPPQMQWIDLGPDTALARRILNRIRAALATSHGAKG